MVVLYELCAGLASLSLSYFGLKPPVSRIGNKTGYVEEIKKALGLHEPPDRIVLVDSDKDLVHTLNALVFEGHLAADEIAYYLRRDPKEAWLLAKARISIAEGSPARAAAWLVRTAGSRGGIGGFKGAHKLRPNVDGFIPSLPSLIERVRAMSTVLRASAVQIETVYADARSAKSAKVLVGQKFDVADEKMLTPSVQVGYNGLPTAQL